jgi:hypothetical protein
MATTEGLRVFSKVRTHLAHTLEISITIEPIHWMPA